MEDYKHINEAIMNGDFSSFDKLDEEMQVDIMNSWKEDMWIKYYTKEGTMTEQEFLNSMYKVIKECSKNESNIQ